MNGQQETSMTSWCVFFRPINGCFFWDKVGEVQKKNSETNQWTATKRRRWRHSALSSSNQRPFLVGQSTVDDVMMPFFRPINGRFFWDHRLFERNRKRRNQRERERERRLIQVSGSLFPLYFRFSLLFFLLAGLSDWIWMLINEVPLGWWLMLLDVTDVH